MINVLVVEAWAEQRARIVDALCELPGIEVSATAVDAARAIRLIDDGEFDAVVTASVLPDATTGTLVTTARDLGVSDVIVFADDDIASLTDYWLDLGARHVVATMPELVARTAELVSNRDRVRARDELLVTQTRDTRLAAARASLAAMPTSMIAAMTMSDVQTAPTVTALARRTRTSRVVDFRELVHETLTGFGRVVPEEVQLVLEASRDLPRVRCVPREIERLLLHLVLDACESVPLGGKVWLFIERDGTNYIRLEVLDSSGRRRGLGVGRDVIWSVVDSHGGDLRIVEHAGGATSVQVVLPAVVNALN